MKELKPLTEYIDKKQADIIKGISNGNALNEIFEHNTWLKTPLSLGQFIPCKDGKPLEKPKPEDYNSHNTMGFDYPKDLQEYQEAEAEVLFKGWEYEEVKNHKNEMYTLVLQNKESKINLSTKNKTYIIEGYKSIESISHLNLILTDKGVKDLT